MTQADWNQFRKIIHLDMDAFYASVEILDQPQLKGKPVIVGGSPNRRSVVSAASYEARKFGVRSAMSSAMAHRLCPQAIILPPRFERYKEISAKIHSIFRRYTDQIEPLALDEAWLDVTQNKVGCPSATWIAQKIKEEIRAETGLTASAGVSYNKFLSKIASEEKKPDGLFVIPPQQAEEFLRRLDLKRLPGVGKVTAERLQQEGLTKGWQLLAMPEDWLKARFGKFGESLFQSIRGVDFRPVRVSWERKSLGIERTFQKDLAYGPPLLQALDILLEKLAERAQSKNQRGKTLTLKIKFADFRQVTRSYTQPKGVWEIHKAKGELETRLHHLLTQEQPGQLVRLLGVSLQNLQGPCDMIPDNQQLEIFEVEIP